MRPEVPGQTLCDGAIDQGPATPAHFPRRLLRPLLSPDPAALCDFPDQDKGAQWADRPLGVQMDVSPLIDTTQVLVLRVRRRRATGAAAAHGMEAFRAALCTQACVQTPQLPRYE